MGVPLCPVLRDRQDRDVSTPQGERTAVKLLQQPPDLSSPFILSVLLGRSVASLPPCRGQAGLWHHPSGTILG